MGGAEITAIRNKVDKLNSNTTREAVVKDAVVEGDQVQTKAGSLAELTFSDKSIARLGANAIFTYNSQERLVKIDKGTVLMQTPPGNGGVTITSGGVTGAITGTTFLLTASPAQCSDCNKELILSKGGAGACIDHPDIKQAGTGGFALCVLEGKNSTKVTGPNGITVEIMPGQMTVVGPTSSGAPKVFVVNLAQILRTCPLIQAFPEPLPSLSAIQQAAIQQQQSGVIKSTGATGLAISSDGDILVGESKPPNPGKRVFEMAVNKPIPGGNKDDSAKDAGLEDIETAAGGDGGAGGGVPSGSRGGGGGAGGSSSVPSTPNPPVTPPPPPSNPSPSPNVLPTAITLTGPANLVAGQLATFNINLDAIAAQDTVVTLSTDARLGGAPATVTIPRGSQTVSFTALVPSAGITFTAGAANVVATSGSLTAGNYSKNLAPTALPGGSFPAALPGGTADTGINLNGSQLNLNAAQDLSLNNLSVTRMGTGLDVQSAGALNIRNSTFDGWMQRSSGSITLDSLGMGTMQFTETAAVAVDKPVLGIKMSSLPGGDMFLGDYRVTISHYPDGTPGSVNDKTVDFLNHTAAALDPIGYGSAANGANLILRDGAVSSINSIDYASFDTAAGEYKPNSPASGLNSGSSTGLWSFLFSNESLNPNGQVDEVKLKYQEGKAVIRGAQGVEIVNVRFEGMDEVELEAASLGGRVLMSGTLVSDPTIGKIAMKALSSVQKSVLTGAGLPNSMDAVEAEINNPNFTGKSDITIAGDRALQIAAINVAGQLALNSHTIVFNNANVTSAGVIDARTRDGMVNRTYGSVVPGTVNFMGVNGNNFLNTANNASMSIANSANIVNALNGGQMRENGAGGATVMNVGRR
jgi:hypothetical protein